MFQFHTRRVFIQEVLLGTDHTVELVIWVVWRVGDICSTNCFSVVKQGTILVSFSVRYRLSTHTKVVL